MLQAQTDSTAIATDTNKLVIPMDTNRIQYRQITRYHYTDGQGHKFFVQQSWYDTTGVTTKRERFYYAAMDTTVTKHYAYHYSPSTRLGEYYTERPERNNTVYTKQVTKFRNYNSKTDQRLWEKIQLPNSKQLARQTEYRYDNRGYLVYKRNTDYTTDPTSHSEENVTRNKVGNATQWTSFDDDGHRKTQARTYTASYLADSLLLKSTSVLYFNITQVTNKYNRKKQLKKSRRWVGNNNSKGKTKWNNKTTTWYKDRRPIKMVEKHLNKTARTIVYSYTSNQTKEQVTSPTQSYIDTKTYTYHDSIPDLPVRYVVTKEGKPFTEETWSYTPDGRLLEYVEVEYRSNGVDWKHIERYNDRGQLYWSLFYLGNVLNKEERFQYRYYPPKAIQP